MWIIIRSVLKKEDEFYEPSRINNGLERRAVCVYVCVRGKYAWCSLFSNAERYTYPNLSPWSLKGFSKTKEGLVSSVWGGTRIASFRFEQSPSLPDSFFFFSSFWSNPPCSPFNYAVQAEYSEYSYPGENLSQRSPYFSYISSLRKITSFDLSGEIL